MINLTDVADIDLHTAQLHEDLKVLQANDKLVKKGEHQTNSQSSPV